MTALVAFYDGSDRRRLGVALAAATAYAALVALAILPRYDAIAFALVAALFSRATARAEDQALAARVSAMFFLVFAGGVYANQLTTGVEGRHALMGGIIPWSDAEGFLSNAWRIGHGLPFSTNVTLTAMRPLYPLSLSFVLSAVGMDVKLALAIYAGVVAVLMGSVASALGARYGARARFAVTVIFAFYLRRYLFVVGTESLGVLAGLVAFRLLLASGTELALAPLAGFFGCFGLALATRPGPVLAVPLLFVWVWRASSRDRVKRLATCAAAFAAALSFNSIVVRATAESGTPGGEFPPILYGAMHGEDYTYLGEVHPEIANLPQTVRMGATARLMAGEIAARPWVALGFLQGSGAFLAGPHGLFSLGFYDPDDSYFEGPGGFGEKVARFRTEAGVYRMANLLGMGVVAVAFVFLVLRGAALAVRDAWRDVRAWRSGAPRTGDGDALTTAARLVFLGAVLSAAVTPPWITEAAQLQASVLPFTLMLPWLTRRTEAPEARATTAPITLWLAPALLAGWLILAFALARRAPLDLPDAPCTDPRAFVAEPSLLVAIQSDEAGGYTMARFRENARFVGKHNPDLTEPLLRRAAPGFAFEMVFDACTGRAAVVMGSNDALAEIPRGIVRASVVPVGESGRLLALPR